MFREQRSLNLNAHRNRPHEETAQLLEVTLGHWVAFGVMVAVLLALDLFVFHRQDHEPTLRESAWWTVFWASLALAFAGLIWWWAGRGPAIDFISGYLVEWSLSMDNVFVFVVIFSYFRVPLKYQYRVLFWGILGAVAMRLTFILAASTLLQKFNWVMVIFGGFLVYTGIKLAIGHDGDPQPDKNPLMRFARWLFPVAKQSHGHQFFAREEGKLCITPLFLVLLVVESTDVIFAVDSVPAIFGVTKDPFLVFTSNVFAILGLRALYFLLAGVMSMFRYLNYGLSAVLVFIGIKMLLGFFLGGKGPDGHESAHLIPNWASLLVIISLLGTSIIASLIAARIEARRGGPAPHAQPTPEDQPPQSHQA